MMNKKIAKETMEELYKTYPDAECELNFTTPFQLLIATVLSAQTTDVKVNEVTKELFKEYDTPEKFLNLSTSELEEKIRKIGLYKNKAKNILLLCRSLIENFNGEVPKTMEELTSLAGVGRKTANVVMSNAFNIPAFAVDTHVFRVSNRIGLATAKNVEETEKQLTKLIDKKYWIKAHHTIIFHGRRICKAIKPKCEECGISDRCEYYKSNKTT